MDKKATYASSLTPFPKEFVLLILSPGTIKQTDLLRIFDRRGPLISQAVHDACEMEVEEEFMDTLEGILSSNYRRFTWNEYETISIVLTEHAPTCSERHYTEGCEVVCWQMADGFHSQLYCVYEEAEDTYPPSGITWGISCWSQEYGPFTSSSQAIEAARKLFDDDDLDQCEEPMPAYVYPQPVPVTYCHIGNVMYIRFEEGDMVARLSSIGKDSNQRWIEEWFEDARHVETGEEFWHHA